MSPAPLTRVRAFTLIELLTVIAIIGILAAILIPVVGKVRSSARQAGCVSNLRQIGTAAQLHAAEFKGLLPARSGSQLAHNQTGTQNYWLQTLAGYIKTQTGAVTASGTQNVNTVFVCPAGDGVREREGMAPTEFDGLAGGYGSPASAAGPASGPPTGGNWAAVAVRHNTATGSNWFYQTSRIPNPSLTIYALDWPLPLVQIDATFSPNLDKISYRHGDRFHVLTVAGSVKGFTRAELNATRDAANPNRNNYWYPGL